MATERPLVEMRNMFVSFGGVHAVQDVSIELYPGEVLALVGGNGAGKSTLIKTLSGAQRPDSGQILIDGEPVTIHSPRDAKAYGVETIYQTLALADNIDAPGNVFLGRELTTRWGTLDDSAMEDATRRVITRLNPKFQNFKSAVGWLSGGQRQSVAIARAVHFNARVLIMDEPTAALGPSETEQVMDLIRQLKREGIGVILISHDIHDVFDLADRISVMLTGRLVGTVEQGRGDHGRGARHDHHRQAPPRRHPVGVGRPTRLTARPAGGSWGRAPGTARGNGRARRGRGRTRSDGAAAGSTPMVASHASSTVSNCPDPTAASSAAP